MYRFPELVTMPLVCLLQRLESKFCLDLTETPSRRPNQKRDLCFSIAVNVWYSIC